MSSAIQTIPHTGFLEDARPAMVRAAIHRMEIVRDEAGFLALEPHWDDLLSRSLSQTPFLSWDWMRTWWECHRGLYQLVIGITRGPGGKITAIAPLALGRRSNYPQRSLRQIAFACTLGEVSSQAMDVIVPAGHERLGEELLHHVLHSTRHEWDIARLDGVPDDSRSLEGMLRALAQNGYGACVLNRNLSRYTRLPETWEQYEAARSSSWRSKIRRKWKALATKPDLRTLLASDHGAPGDVFEDLVRLHSLKYPSGVSEFLLPRSLKFHRKIVERWGASKRVLMPYVEIEGRTVGAMYGFRDGDRFYHYQMGWEPSLANLSMGQLAVAWCLRSAIEHGTRDYDMLPGAADYKKRWCDRERHYLDLEAFSRQSPRGLLFRVLRSIRRMKKTDPAPLPPCACEGAGEE